MAGAVQWIGPAGIGLAGARAIVRRAIGLIGRVIGIGKLVVLALGHSAPADPQPLQPAQPVALQAAPHVLVEKLVVAELVGRDLGADLLQYRLVGRVLERAVI